MENTEKAVREQLLDVLGLSEDEMGEATLLVETSGTGQYTWAYNDSMTCDWGTATVEPDGAFSFILDPGSSSYDGIEGIDW